MELCLITPAAHVKWTSLLPGRFCLANVTRDEYREAFAIDTDVGYDVVLDNGVFENDLVTNEQYIEVIHEIKPQVVIAPDLMNARAKTNLEFANNFVVVLGPAQYNFKLQLMFVPQCEWGDIKGYESALREAINGPHFRWIGICRNACFNAFGQFTHTEDEAMNKFAFGVWAEQNGILKLAHETGMRFHLLGIGGNLSMLQYLWWVDRADTASLFFQATLGNTVSRDGILSEEVSRPTDYFRRTFGNPNKWHNALEHNCAEALKYASMAKRLKHSILKDRI